MVLNLSSDHAFLLRMCSGSGGYTRVELLALWGLLSFTSHRNILSIKFLGDSKIIVDWENEFSVLQIYSLDHCEAGSSG